MHITSLPLDVFFLILEYLSLNDLLSLYAVSKGFLHLIAPEIFSTISVDLGPRDAYSQLSVFKSISTSSSISIIAPAVKTLYIDSLRIWSWREVTDSVKEIIRQTHEDKIGFDQNAVQSVILEHLMLCLTKLQNLETVK
jgi:F-box associated protein